MRRLMLFNSFAFAVFLPAVFILYWILPQKTPRVQNAFLIATSCLFYGWWDYRFLGLLLVSSVIDFIAGRLLAVTGAPLRRKWLVALSLGVNLAILGFFKYYGFFAHSFADLLGAMGFRADIATLNIILPVGLSFYTFQSMAYTIDIYRSHLTPARNWIDFFAFVSFFPQLVAGPIQRAGELLPQFQRTRELRLNELRLGGEQLLWGLFKKVVIADNLAGPVEQIFNQAPSMGSRTLVCGAFFFAIQIYCDFSGYSDMAIGIARFFGFKLTRNFAYPYFARNLIEFWQRWHISLSTWFRDYVYIPLGGNRVGKGRHWVNLVLTFAISGLWHGANWTFIVWGLLHGLLYLACVSILGGRPREVSNDGRVIPSLGDFTSMACTFGVVSLAWIFFRADSSGAAIGYLSAMFSNFSGGTSYIPAPTLLKMSAFGSCLLLIEWLRRTKTNALELPSWPRYLRWPIYYGVILLILWEGNFNYVPFIYFNF